MCEGSALAKRTTAEGTHLTVGREANVAVGDQGAATKVCSVEEGERERERLLRQTERERERGG